MVGTVNFKISQQIRMNVFRFSQTAKVTFRGAARADKSIQWPFSEAVAEYV